jgi:hypothetical protein
MNLLIKGPYSSKNFGDYLMLVSMLNLLQQQGKDLNYYIYTTTYDSLKKTIMEEFDGPSREKMHFFKGAINFFINFLRSKIIFFGGGSQIVKRRSPWQILALAILSRLFMKKFFCCSIDGDYFSYWYRLALKLSKAVIFRVPEHYKQSKQFLKNSYLLPDIGSIYFLDLINRTKYLGQKKDKKYLCYSKNSDAIDYNETNDLVRSGFIPIAQDFEGQNNADTSMKSYFLTILGANQVVSYHYHTLLLCHLAGIPYLSTKPYMLKHKSIAKFTKQEYSLSKKAYSYLFASFLN